MILYALVLVAVLFFISCNLFMENKIWHRSMTVISSIALLLAIGASVGNFRYHHGMHLVNHTRTERLASITKQQPMLVYEKLGSAKKHTVVIYKHSINGKRLHTKADTSVKNKVVTTNGSKAYLKVTHRKFEYKSGMQRAMFGLAQKSQTKSTTNTFYVPKNWTVLSATQVKNVKKYSKVEAKNIKKQMANPKAQMMLKQKAQEYVQAEVMKNKRSNPKMTPQQLKGIMSNAQKVFKAQLQQEAKQQVASRAIADAKKTPVGYVTK